MMLFGEKAHPSSSMQKAFISLANANQNHQVSPSEGKCVFCPWQKLKNLLIE
jgi:hypothetical protein